MGFGEHSIEGTKELEYVSGVWKEKEKETNHDTEGETQGGREEGGAFTDAEVFPSRNLPTEKIETDD